MKYTLQSGKYVFKNFIYLFPFAILPAFFLAVSTDQEAIVGVVKALLEGDISKWSFKGLYKAISVLNFASWESIVFGIVGIVMLVLCVALLMALLEKHMRIGKRTLNGLLGRLNDNFLSTFAVFLIVLLTYELWSLLLSASLFFLSRIPFTAWAYALAGTAFLVFHVLLMLSIGMIYLWLPCMQITGFRAFEAYAYAYQLMRPIKLGIMLAQICVLFAVESLICLCAVHVVSATVFLGVASLLYAGVLMIFCVRMQVAYFDRDNIERADTRKYYNRK